MAVISVDSPRGRRGSTITETDEYVGFWINVGVRMAPPEGSDEEPVFVRLPRGIAVSDLKERKIYDNMDPVYAGQANLMNQLIQEIRKRSLGLNEGESCTINLEAVLYRRQEESAKTDTPMANADLADALFG